jgi:hypothetical protein
MKSSAKRRRSKWQIEEDKENEEKRKLEIERKLANMEQMQ